MEMTSQLRATAERQMREPRKPLPPKTMRRLVAVDMVGCENGEGVQIGWMGERDGLI